MSSPLSLAFIALFVTSVAIDAWLIPFRRTTVSSNSTTTASSLTTTNGIPTTEPSTVSLLPGVRRKRQSANKVGYCPDQGLYYSGCTNCTSDQVCPGAQRCCRAGDSNKNCCFAVYWHP